MSESYLQISLFPKRSKLEKYVYLEVIQPEKWMLCVQVVISHHHPKPWYTEYLTNWYNTSPWTSITKVRNPIPAFRYPSSQKLMTKMTFWRLPVAVEDNAHLYSSLQGTFRGAQIEDQSAQEAVSQRSIPVTENRIYTVSTLLTI